MHFKYDSWSLSNIQNISCSFEGDGGEGPKCFGVTYGQYSRRTWTVHLLNTDIKTLKPELADRLKLSFSI